RRPAGLPRISRDRSWTVVVLVREARRLSVCAHPRELFVRPSLYLRLLAALTLALTSLSACASAQSRAATTPSTVGGTISCAYTPTGGTPARSVGTPPTRASQ